MFIHIRPLNKTGHDSFIDFLKGVCIIFVVLTHCIPPTVYNCTLFCLWGDLAVPLFLVIQVFHAYKKGVENCRFPSPGKIWKRIILPFLLYQIPIFLLYAVTHKGSMSSHLLWLVKEGGGGPGSYYVWIYLEFAILLPLMSRIPIWKNRWICFLVILAVSEMLEVFCSMVSIPDSVYRLLFFRYFFLIWCGIRLIDRDIILDTKILILSVAGICLILLFRYSEIDYQPFICNSKWRIFHWPVYFYVTGLLLVGISCLYGFTSKHAKKLNHIIELAGKSSYEIFLFQMLWFYVINSFDKPVAEFLSIDKTVLEYIVFIISVPVCVWPIIKIKDRSSS